ncbi:MAG: DUF3375 domain-containing protein [Alphaproteobacteria bacterium CG_4_10_14_0_2_um_filter_63_37]|nr:MAG: hypothetical protein AUJ55_12945 [Proteobacteria bacterium CG1_02_64_396]PJA25142.1 MAG: DUF3375 domain-containing protein [Alphaproteobacteria bacterium CG_4_10_14_0_2_um_filter_63_37]
MPLDFATLDLLRQNHPALRLLRSDHLPLVASFLDRAFIAPNRRSIPQADLVEALEDELFALRERLGREAFPKGAQEYLDDWADPSKGWLRKYYPPDDDQPHFDPTPAAEKGIAWLGTLAERAFVGTESRLLTLFELLKQIQTGSQSDPEARLTELRRRREELDAEIERAKRGEIALLDDTALKERFQQFVQTARELLSDFREVEHNFRGLDRTVRERIALWEGRKGELLEQIMGERDAIGDSDQGRSFRAFWDFLMSRRRQEELTALLDRVLRLPPIAGLDPDPRLRRVHYDWLEAGEHTQRTVARLSQQLRRFLDDRAWLENRRIMDLLRGIETHALALRESPPSGDIVELAGISAAIELPFERPLYTPSAGIALADLALEAGEEAVDTGVLFEQIAIDKEALRRNIRAALRGAERITLAQLCDRYPLSHGLAELVAYLQLAAPPFTVAVDETRRDMIVWQIETEDGGLVERRAELPRIIFLR